MSERSVRQASGQWAFFACLLLVGAGTMLTISVGSACWPFCAFTLSVMVLGATLDAGGHRQVRVV